MDRQAEIFCQLIKNIIHPEQTVAVQEEIDWGYQVQLAKAHNLLPILVEEASKYPSHAARAEYMTEMNETLAMVDAQVKRTEAFLRLYEAFVAADLHPIVMKGLICRQLYGALGDHRPSSDEDILIRPEEYWRAKEVLIANGYVAWLDGATESQLTELQEISFVHPAEKLHIELHLNAIGKEDDERIRMNERFNHVFENYRECQIQNVTLRTMNHYDHLLFLILHAFKHFVGSGLGVRQMLDILLYQEKYGTDIDVSNLFENLQELKALSFWSDIIHIGNSCFGFHLQAPEKPRCPQDLLENMLESGTFGSRNEAEKVAANTVRNARNRGEGRTTSNVIVMILQMMFPSKEYMLVFAPQLEEKPYLLPMEWMKRWGRFLKRNRRQDENLAITSMRTSRRRIKMLKKYDLI